MHHCDSWRMKYQLDVTCYFEKSNNKIGRCINYEFIDFKIAYYSCMNEVLYTIFLEFWYPHGTSSVNENVFIWNLYSYPNKKYPPPPNRFPLHDSMKYRDAVSLFLFICFRISLGRLKTTSIDWNWTGYTHLWFMLSGSPHTLKQNADTLSMASREVCLWVNAE